MNPGANETKTNINDLHDQPSVFYVHLGYKATTVDITLREALSYFVQALTGSYGDYTKGGLLASTSNNPKEGLKDAASNSLLKNYTKGVCECLNASYRKLPEHSQMPFNCTKAAAGIANIVACYKDVQHPLISMNDLMRNETVGYSPGRPTSGGESGLNLWAGIPNFGTLGIYPMPGIPPSPHLGCHETSSDGTHKWGPYWTCPNVTTVDVDLRNYMPKSQVDSLSRFVGGNTSGQLIPFKLTAYYFDCDCAGSALIGVTSDIELDLIDKLEPFVGQNCGSNRSV